jgi:hypothetical protein
MDKLKFIYTPITKRKQMRIYTVNRMQRERACAQAKHASLYCEQENMKEYKQIVINSLWMKNGGTLLHLLYVPVA